MTLIEHEILAIGSLAAAEHAADRNRVWQLESLRAPAPLHPLEYDLTARLQVRAFTAAATEIGLPVEAASLRVGGYPYRSYSVVSCGDAELQQQAHDATGRIAAAVERIGERWECEQLPEIDTYLALWRGFHLRGASITALIKHFDQTLFRLERIWRIASDAGLAIALAPRLLAELHAMLFGEQAAGEVGQLLQGIDSEARSRDRALRQLAAEARVRPYVREALRWCADHEVIEVLLASEEGRAFLKLLRALLRDGRSHGEPGSIEDPLPLIRRLKEYAAQPEPAAQEAVPSTARRLLEAEVTARLASLEPGRAQHYSAILRAAQDAVRLRDERAAAGERAMTEVRRVMLEFGRRFAEAGIVALAGDVFYLDAAEVRQAAETMPWVDMRPRIMRRRTALERARLASPARSLGDARGAPDDVERRLLELVYDAA